MSKIKDLLGTISTIFRLGIGTSSVILKNLGGSLSFRNSTDSAFVDVACKNVGITDALIVQNATTNNLPISFQAYNSFGELGFSVPRLQIRDGRMDFDPGSGKAEIRVTGETTQLNFYNRSSFFFYLKIDSTGDTFLSRDLFNARNIIAGSNDNPSNSRLYVDGDSHLNGIARLKPFTQATLPSASANPGAIAYVTDGSYPLAISNGSSWLFPGSGGGESSGVSSFNSRTGSITPQSEDYASFYVAADDARLTDARTPTAHNQSWSTITDTPTTLSGYGITDLFPRYNSIGSTVPTSPTDGFRWLETNAAGLKIGDWTFRSATSDWIENNFSVLAASGTNVAAGNTVRLINPSRLSSKILIESVELVVAAMGAQSASAFYTFTLQSIAGTITTTNVPGVDVLNTKTLSVGSPTVYSQQNANVTLTIGSGGITGLILLVGKTSTPGNINYDYRVTVRRIR